MQIAAEKEVSIEYTLKDTAGKVLDTSDGGEPLLYLDGASNIVPGLETALEGKAEGDSSSAEANRPIVVDIDPADGSRLTRRCGWFVVMVCALSVASGGCGRERVCRVGEYPARSIEFPVTGRVCVADGHEPPAGYERFPPGQEPVYVDQDR